MKKTDFMLGVLLAIIALTMIVAPRQWVQVIVIALGVEAIANGAFGLIKIRRLVVDKMFQNVVLVRSVISIVIGLLAVILPLRFAEFMWTVMLYMLAAYLLAAAALELFTVAKLRGTNIERRQYIIEVIVSLIGAVILFIIPQKIGTALIRILGVVLLLTSAGYLLFEWRNRPIVVDDVEVVDDTRPPTNDEPPQGN